MKLELVSRIDDKKAVEYSQNLKNKLESDGFTVLYEKSKVSFLKDRTTRYIDSKVDLVVVIGGDGTILRTVQRMKRQVPIIGINWGEVGFLTDLEPEEVMTFFSTIKLGFAIEKRMRISISSDNGVLGTALNEALIVTSRPAKMLRFSVIIDRMSAGTFRADGLLISTPTGSTAYAMSAGGPIIDPRIEGFLLVPLAPYMLSSRPLLVGNKRSLKIRLESNKPATLVIDGQRTWKLTERTVLAIEQSSEPALFVDVGKKFFNKVDNKLRRL